jgi:hypothetical protein
MDEGESLVAQQAPIVVRGVAKRVKAGATDSVASKTDSSMAQSVAIPALSSTTCVYDQVRDKIFGEEGQADGELDANLPVQNRPAVAQRVSVHQGFERDYQRAPPRSQLGPSGYAVPFVPAYRGGMQMPVHGFDAQQHHMMMMAQQQMYNMMYQQQQQLGHPQMGQPYPGWGQPRANLPPQAAASTPSKVPEIVQLGWGTMPPAPPGGFPVKQ